MADAGDTTPRVEDEEVGKSPATHISGAASHVRSQTRSAKRGAGDLGRDKVHGASKRRIQRNKNVPPYKHMSEQLEKKLGRVEEQIREAQAMESKLLRKENVKEQQAERDIHGVEEEITKVDDELNDLQKQLVAQKKKYEEKDTANVKEFERKVHGNREQKTVLQQDIEHVQSKYHRTWRENYNLKMFHQMNSYWSRKKKEPQVADSADAKRQAMEDDQYGAPDQAAEKGFAAELEDGDEEDADANPFQEESSNPFEEGGTTGHGVTSGTGQGETADFAGETADVATDGNDKTLDEDKLDEDFDF